MRTSCSDFNVTGRVLSLALSFLRFPNLLKSLDFLCTLTFLIITFSSSAIEKRFFLGLAKVFFDPLQSKVVCDVIRFSMICLLLTFVRIFWVRIRS